MRSAVFSPPDGAARGEWRVLRMLAPYLWEYRWRVAIALVFLVTAKLANVGVPLVMKEIVDGLDGSQQVLVLPLAEVPMDRMIERSLNTPMKGASVPKNQASVKPSHGSDGKTLSLKAKTQTTASGSAR